MKSIFIVIILIITLSACNKNRSGNRTPVKENQADTISTTKVEIPEQKVEDLGDQIFAFWVKKVEVKPIVINENGVYGEGEEPATTLEYEIYFLSSEEEGREEQFSAWSYIPKKITSDEKEEPWYKEQVESFKRLKELYNKIINAPKGRLYVEGNQGKIEKISLKVDIKEKKVGNAKIRQDDMVVLWTKYGY